MSRYRCVDAQKAAGFPVVAACDAAGVTRSAYYAWAASAAQGPSQHERDETGLVADIRHIHARSGGVYGSPRVTAELGRRGWTANHKRVERLMRLHGIVGYRPRRRRSLTRPDTVAAPAPDLLGYSMGSHHDARLVTCALDAAVAVRGRSRMPDTIFHTDRGAEYTSSACIQACQRLGLRRSMGRTGSCLDNAVAEAWFASLKVELVDRCHYRTRAEARTAIFRWVAW